MSETDKVFAGSIPEFYGGDPVITIQEEHSRVCWKHSEASVVGFVAGCSFCHDLG